MATFLTRDPRHPDFWDERFEKNFMPWDKGNVPAALQAFVQAATQPLHTLIPGCGNGYEAAYLAQAGWDVTAIDFSPAAVQSARVAIGVWGRHVIEADFFSYTPAQPLGLIYERAFFCALPPEMRPDIIKRWARLLPAGALLAGYFFHDDAQNASTKGPPFTINSNEFRQLMAPFFDMLEDNPVSDSISVFEGRERWQIWRRRS
ncbi:methyltransferase domain-containing protein [Undibacterium sp. CY18W]|uniref:Methyltransferase domain-containing protein n=1 Tax=Undibacterium hunanense TaxID=2762292 RepID=A0ABR6ZXK5_9BURK|nr:methyltransferase domain-containing protein [Undibacterium hunanense]MBC3920596.1 methyltransferase domain-containing protein [Undibacterium hunanense]